MTINSFFFVDAFSLMYIQTFIIILNKNLYYFFSTSILNSQLHSPTGSQICFLLEFH